MSTLDGEPVRSDDRRAPLSGLVIGGPCDGQWIAQPSNRFSSTSIGTGRLEPPRAGAYHRVHEMITTTSWVHVEFGGTGFWWPEGVRFDPILLIARLSAHYRPEIRIV